MSVIIPVFMAQDYLPRCIDSIISQTYENLEIILINDGSKDGCGAICDIYADKDERVRVVHKKNEGVSEARNVGIRLATGHYIVFVDCDDFIDPNMIGTMVFSLEKNNVELAIVGFEYLENRYGSIKVFNLLAYDKKIITKRKELLMHFYPFFNKPGFNNVCGKLYLASVIRSKKLFFSKTFDIGEDAVFNLGYFSHISSCVLLPFTYYKYWFELNISTKRYDPNIFSKRLELLSMFTNFLLFNNLSLDGLWLEYVKACYAGVMSLFHPECKKSLDGIRSDVRLIIRTCRAYRMLILFKPKKVFECILKFVLSTGNVNFILIVAKLMKKFQLIIRRA